jgi:hypothetical protein
MVGYTYFTSLLISLTTENRMAESMINLKEFETRSCFNSGTLS